MMPSSNKKQHNFMEAIAHSAAFAKKVGISQKVGKDFAEADKGKKFSRGGQSQATIQSINKPKTNHGAEALFKTGGTMATMSAKMAKFEKSGKDVEKKGMKEGSKADMALDKMQMMGMKKGGMKKMAAGGMSETMGSRSMSSDVEKGSNRNTKHGEHAIQKRGKTRAMMPKMAGSDTGMKRGGKVKK
jgi:hypothetical protein